MGFLLPYSPQRAKRDPFHGITPEFMAAAGCTGCPLASQPKALAAGAMPAEVYLLGEAPGREEGEQGVPFVGPSGKLLRDNIPVAWRDAVRFNNVVQSMPPRDMGKQTAPSQAAMAHCRGFLESDIEAAAPRAIFGFGNTPLAALLGQSGITKFAGRRMPVQIGRHRCWYFAFLHPAAILHADARQQADMTALFAAHLRAAFARVDTLPEPLIDTSAEARGGVTVLRDAKRIEQFLFHAATLDRVGFDYETTGLSPYAPGARLLTAAVATADETVAFPLDHRGSGWSADERMMVFKALQYLLEAETVKLAHNAAFELLWSLAFFGKRAARATRWGCSLAQAFLLDTRPRAHSLDFLCQLHFGLELKKLSNIDVTHLDDAPVEQVCRYNALDAKYCLKVFEAQQPYLDDDGLAPLYAHHMARIAALVRGQHLGLPLDAGVNAAMTADYRKALAKIETQLASMDEVTGFEAAGTKFNVGSPKHVADALHKVGVHLDGTAEELLAMVGTPFTKAVLKWRGINKVLSTYLLPFGPDSKLVHDGSLHPVIATTHTRTWRTASEEPNIQNWPKRDEGNREVRRQLVARPGCWLVSVDYSGIQARNVAMESRDRNLVQHFIDRYDIHGDWSQRIQRADPRWAKKRAPKVLRHLAKNKMVFPLFFGAQPGTLGHYLGVEERVGQALYDEFWGEFPDVRRWHERLRRDYRKHHYVTGLTGFRRAAPISDNQLINTPIQSDEALLVCEALTRLSEYEDDALQPVFMVHDDLTFMLPKDRLDDCMEVILTEMLRVEHLWVNVPLAVEASIGSDWFDQSKLGEFESAPRGYVEIP